MRLIPLLPAGMLLLASVLTAAPTESHNWVATAILAWLALGFALLAVVFSYFDITLRKP